MAALTNTNDLFQSGKPTANRSARRCFSVPTNNTAPSYVPTAVMVDTDGTITGLLADNDSGDTPQVFTVKAGIIYPLALARVTAVSGVTVITGMC